MHLSPSGFGKTFAVLCLAGLSCCAQAAPDAIDARVDDLLRQMTLEEKAGQLTQYSSNWHSTGPVNIKPDLQQLLQSGRVGSMLNVLGAQYTRGHQEQAMRSRLKIPLLFGQDVVHGYHTIFPIPLAEAASWDLPAIERSARVAATEAAAAGIHWTFAPMVDIARDPRWGRVLEGAGEDPYLASRIAYARVKGFQGRKLGDLDAVMATAKHFAAYGAALAGRDYNSVDMSERSLRETYLPPFKAAVDAGVASFMNAFNDVNGVPSTGNAHLLRDILKGEWAFTGLVVSDWGSIGELVTHGYAKDDHDAARLAIMAGSDVDMESNAYRDELPALVKSGVVPMALVDDAVRRVLRKKFELGLFEDPYRYSNAERERQTLGASAHRQAARDMADKSIVLLKHTPGVLPLSPKLGTVAFIGPMVKLVEDNLGAWAVRLPTVDQGSNTVTQWDGLRRRLPNTRLLYAQGCDVMCTSREGFAQAVDAARQADVVIVSLGERWDMSGEARSRTRLRLPGLQEELVAALHATGKPIVLLVNAGRPLIFDGAADRASAVLYTWWLGVEAGNAIADVLLGDVNPSARLPITFPRHEGQIPIYYNHLNTGRPVTESRPAGFVSGYIDEQNTPRYAFGFGLSYTSFDYGHLQLDKTQLRRSGRLVATVQITNTGARSGEEVVQLYVRDPVASVVRPVKELKDFQKVRLAPGETRTVRFEIDAEKLSFYNTQLQWVAEPGRFELMVGAASDDIRLRGGFELLD